MLISVPYYPHKAIDGFYSGLYKRSKKSFEFKTLISSVISKKWIDKKISERTIISFENNVKMDIPFEITTKDVKIINHHLDGLKMAIQN